MKRLLQFSVWPLLAVTAFAVVAASPLSVCAAENEAAVILAQLEDLPSDTDPPQENTLAEPGELPAPADASGQRSSDPTKINLSEAEDLLEQEEVIPLCTTGEVYNGDLWYTHFDFIYLFNQPLRKNFTVARDTSDPERMADLLTDNLKLRWRPGMRFTIGRELGPNNTNRDQSIEFTYAGLFDWYQETSLTGIGGGPTVTNTFMSSFPDANTVEAEFQAQLNSFELNFRLDQRLEKDRLVMKYDGTWTRQCEPGFLTSLYGGLRYVKYDQSFVIRTSRTEVGSGYNAIQALETENDMFGLQVGADLNHQDCRWSWGIHSKVGALINAASRYRRDAVTFEGGGGGDFVQRGEDNQLAILLELGMFAKYQLHPKVAATVSYDAMWLHGIAIAPDGIEEFGFGLDKDIDANENGIFHGLSLGLETKW